MSRCRAVIYVLGIVLLFSMIGGLVGEQVAMAADRSSRNAISVPLNQELFEDSLKLSSKFPVLQAKSGEAFEFEVEFIALVSEDRTFDLTIDTPQNWVSIMQPRYDDTQISAIRIREFQAAPETIKVIVAPVPWDLPEPGEYPIILTATSGDLKESIVLKATVTARYGMDVYTETGRLNTKATAGEDNHLAIKVRNSGSADLDKITLSSSKPEGWLITFNPENVDNLAPGLAQDVDVVIKPADKAIAGDYMITLRANSKEINDSISIRVTVVTPTIWGWLGIVIVLAVIAGLVIMFRQLGRR